MFICLEIEKITEGWRSSRRTLGLADVVKRGRLTGRATGTFPPDGMKVPPSLKLRRRLRANRCCGCVTSVHKGVFCCTSRYTTVLYSPVVMETSTCPRSPGETDPGRKSGHLVFTFSLGRHSFQTLPYRRWSGAAWTEGEEEMVDRKKRDQRTEEVRHCFCEGGGGAIICYLATAAAERWRAIS